MVDLIPCSYLYICRFLGFREKGWRTMFFPNVARLIVMKICRYKRVAFRDVYIFEWGLSRIGANLFFVEWV